MSSDAFITSKLQDASLEESPVSAEEQVQDLIRRCKRLHDEVETYVAAVDAKKLVKGQNPVEYRTLRNDFRHELGFLQKLQDSKMSEEKIRNHIVSSNLVYYEALWNAAKRSTGLLSFRKYFFWNRDVERHKAAYKGLSLGKGSQVRGKSAALVDIVSCDGLEWIRVSTSSEKRLLFDLAKLGWQNDSSDEDEDEEMQDQNSDFSESGDEDEVSLVRSARELARAARANPIRGQPPKVRFVLTRIQSGHGKEIDQILQKIRATGAIVECANEVEATPSLESALPNLLVDRSRILSDVLNIDCTILLALISDISHAAVQVLDWYPGEVKAQIKEEAEERLLPSQLYPTIGNRRMVCTEEAAHQMMQIVDTIATESEKLRAGILLGEVNESTPQELLQAWSQLSEHPTPEDFRLPIKVVSSNLDNAQLPAAAEHVAKELGPLNSAIFFYGWAEGITTLSSNRARARQIEHTINQKGMKDGEAGPHIWLCGESRSLIAKQGRRR